jgi:hypothetical protein
VRRRRATDDVHANNVEPDRHTRSESGVSGAKTPPIGAESIHLGHFLSVFAWVSMAQHVALAFDHPQRRMVHSALGRGSW